LIYATVMELLNLFLMKVALIKTFWISKHLVVICNSGKGTVIEREAKIKNTYRRYRNFSYQIKHSITRLLFYCRDETDGGEDIEWNTVIDIQKSSKTVCFFRHKVAMEVRKYLSDLDFLW
jgi:hypothetical protein